jgi:hypothetical protein
MVNANWAEEIEEVVGSIPEWEGVARIATYLSLMAVRREKSISARTGTLTSYSLFKHKRLERHFMKIIEALESNEWFVFLLHHQSLGPRVFRAIICIQASKTMTDKW